MIEGDIDPAAARRALPSFSDDEDDQIVRRYAAAVWSCLVEPGDGVAGALVLALGADVALREVVGGSRDGAAADASGIERDDYAKALARWRPRLIPYSVDGAFARAARAGAQLLIPDDVDWPAPVSDLGVHAPLCLWVRGDPTLLGRGDPAVALVGSRAASKYGEFVATDFAADLAGRGVTVVSGAAYGIDGAAHRGALAAGGTTVALLAGGADHAYPTGHTELIAQIAATGVVASEVPCGSTPTKWRFLQRNRLIAAMAGATVVVEAGWRSGSLNTAGHASELGRPLGVVPGEVTSAASAGCHRLLRESDARCVTTTDEILELIGLGSFPVSGRGGRTDDHTRVRDALSPRVARSTLEIARRCGMDPAETGTILGLLSLEGAALAGPGGWRLAARR